MANARFQLFRSATQTLTLALSGELDESTALYCERETRADLALVVRRSLRVLWDLQALTGYSLEARVVFVRLQQYLSNKALRIAYVADGPVARSLALWSARMGNQSGACIAADHAAAADWLSGRDESAVRIVVPQGLQPVSPVLCDAPWARKAIGH
jgi:hypothetical protein